MAKAIRQRILAIMLGMAFGTSIHGQTQVPNFTVTDLNGHPHTLYDYLDSNKFVVLDFFFTNCSFCQYYAPHMQQSYEDFGCNKGNTIFLGIDYGDSTQQVLSFIQTYGTEYPVASGLNGGGDSVVAAYNISSFPSVLLINPQRYLMKVVTSPTTDFVDTVLSLAGCIIQPCNLGIAVNPDFSWNASPIPVAPNGLISFEMPADLKDGWMEMIRVDGVVISEHSVVPGKNTIGAPAYSGIYILRLIHDGESSTQRLIVL